MGCRVARAYLNAGYIPRGKQDRLMTIELFGLPAAGRTTLAHTLHTELEKHGLEVQLILSFPIRVATNQKAASCWPRTRIVTIGADRGRLCHDGDPCRLENVGIGILFTEACTSGQV
jgi:Ni2+-binding GTPase involved in maturation of urease and hydrogenase